MACGQLRLEGSPVVDMQERLVAHEEGPHDLQSWNFQGKVEWGDDRDGAIGPSQASAGLSLVISRDSEAPSHEAHLQIDPQLTEP